MTQLLFKVEVKVGSNSMEWKSQDLVAHHVDHCRCFTLVLKHEATRNIAISPRMGC